MNSMMIKASTFDKVVAVELKLNGTYLIEKYPLRRDGQFPLWRLIRSALKLYKMDLAMCDAENQVPYEFEHPEDTQLKTQSGRAGNYSEGTVQPGAVAEITDIERIKLWAHCVSEHANILSPETSISDLIDYHEHEHNGPCTIRNHNRDDLKYSIKKIGKVLSESDED